MFYINTFCSQNPNSARLNKDLLHGLPNTVFLSPGFLSAVQHGRGRVGEKPSGSKTGIQVKIRLKKAISKGQIRSTGQRHLLKTHLYSSSLHFNSTNETLSARCFSCLVPILCDVSPPLSGSLFSLQGEIGGKKRWADYFSTLIFLHD